MTAATFTPFGQAEFFDANTVREPGRVQAWLLAIIVHLALAAFLFYGMRWQSGKPEVIEAELMVLAPIGGAPPVVVEKPAPVVVKEKEPEPAVEKPDIVVKEAEPVRVQPKPEPKLEVRPQPPKPVVKPEPKTVTKRETIQDQLNRELSKEAARDPLKDQMAREERAGVAGAAGREASQRGQSEWADRIRAKVRGRMRDYADAPSNYVATFRIDILPSYDVMNARLTKSSGNAEFDQDAERAIRAASPLPRPKDESSYQSTLTINFRARN
jgi:colicin import membrane protein